MPSYRAYGLTLSSDLPLPELLAGHEEADVTVRFGTVAEVPAEAREAGWYVHATEEGVLLFWEEAGRFYIRDGREITIDPVPGAEERVLRLFLLGTTLAMLLHQRGAVVLHGSAVAVAGRAVAFVGDKGTGKSTMAAMFHGRGHDLVADDVLAIHPGPGGAVVPPGFPHLKLWPDSIAALGLSLETLPRLRDELEKRGHRIGNGFSRGPVGLRCIYVLGLGPEPAVVPLHPRDALQALMPHWYGARFGMELLRALGLAAFFRQCASLADTAAVCRLERPPSLSRLADLARLVEEHQAQDLPQARA